MVYFRRIGVTMKLLIAILVVFTAVAVFTDTRAKAGEWNEKPVMCGEETEVFGLMGSKDEQLLMTGDLLAKVKDPDEANGLSPVPAILPLAVYVNFDTGSFTIVERHGDPYNVYCIIALGQGMKLPNYGGTE